VVDPSRPSELGPPGRALEAPAPRGPGGARARREALEALAREVRACTLCPLSQSRTHAVVYRGSLRPRVVFVGEAPGAAEDRAGVPFVGRSGRLLDRALAGLGAAVGEYGVLNVLKCRPPANRFDRSAAATCRPYLDRQLALLRPRLLVPLGAKAWAALAPGGPPILQAAGAPYRTALGWLFPLIHPAAALRSTRRRERWERDVGALGRWLGGPAVEML
jgi:uracil-DNA glycosylase